MSSKPGTGGLGSKLVGVESLRFQKDGMVRVDGVPAFKLVERDGQAFVQLCDQDRMRAQCRGTRFVEIPLELFVANLEASHAVRDT